MRSRNAFYKYDIDENYYFPLDPYREEQLVSEIGNFTVETLWVTEDLSGVTIYSAPDVIIGVAIHDSSGTSIVGLNAGDKDYLPIHGPDEFLAGVVVRMHPFYDFPLLKVSKFTFVCQFYFIGSLWVAQDQLGPAMLFLVLSFGGGVQQSKSRNPRELLYQRLLLSA